MRGDNRPMDYLEERPSAWPWALLILLAYPWLNPIAPNPSPMMVPWLVAWLCGILAWWRMSTLAPLGAWRGAPGLGAWLALWVLVVVWRSASLNSETLFTLAALALLAMAVDMGARAVTRPGLLRLVLWAWLVAALASSVIALLQYLEWAAPFYPFMNVATDGEAFANLRQRNQFATLANMGLAVLVLAGLGGTANKRPPHQPQPEIPAAPAANRAPGFGRNLWSWQTLWPWLAMGLLVKANAASASRTGMIGVLLVAALALLWRQRLSRAQLGLALVAPVVYFLAAFCLPYVSLWATGHMGNSIFMRLDLGGLQSCTSRKALYLNVLELIAQKPWLGWGWRELSFAHYQASYNSPRFCEILDNAHNLPLHLAVELGIPAAALLLMSGLVPVLRVQPWREKVPVRQVAWVVLALLLLHSMLEYPLWYGPFLIAFGLCLGMLWPDSSLPTQGKPAIAESAPGANPDPDLSQAAPGGLGTPFLVRTAIASTAAFGVLFAWAAFLSMSQQFVVESARSQTLLAFNQRWPLGQWLFARQTAFAQLVTTPPEETTPAARYALASALLHYSPEPRVIQAQLESAEQLGLPPSQVQAMARQYEAVYPQEYRNWRTK